MTNAHNRSASAGKVISAARMPYPETEATAVSRLPARLNAFRMLSHAEQLTGPVIDPGLTIMTKTALAPRLRELVVMATACWTHCDYVAVQHRRSRVPVVRRPRSLACLARPRPLTGQSAARPRQHRREVKSSRRQSEPCSPLRRRSSSAIPSPRTAWPDCAST